MWNEFMPDQPAIGDRTVKYGPRWRRDELPKLGVNTVGGDDNIAFGGNAFSKRHLRHVAVLREAGWRDCPVLTTHGRKFFSQHRYEIRTVAFRMWRSSLRKSVT